MKNFLVLIALFISASCFAQKWSFDFGASYYYSTGFAETELSSVPLYNGIEGRASTAASFQINYAISEILILQSGLGISSYSYQPLTDLRWGSQNQNGAFRDIGFDENGLVENTYLSLPIGIESTLTFGRLILHPQFQFKLNYSIQESPLNDLDAEINKSFITCVLSIGVTVIKLKNISLILAPFVEVKPYDLEMDHAYSDEKLLLTGLSVNLRFHRGNLSNSNI